MNRKSIWRGHWGLGTITLVCAATAALLWSGEVSGQGAQGTTRVAQPETGDPSGSPLPAGDVQHFLTVDVEVTDDGFQPSSLTLPAGERIQLLVRNHGSREHHFHIMGLVPEDMLWLEQGRDGLAEGSGDDVDEAEHAAHHAGATQLVPFHTCTSGICPTENAVHAHAEPGEVDVVWFTATNRGTFEVVDPLDPGRTGSVTVY